MLLGLHTYSFHLHGMGQNWGGHTLAWPRVMDIFKLMDWAVDNGLDGLHITAVDCESTDEVQLTKIKDAGDDGPETARGKEYEAVVKSIQYCRNVLNI